MGNEVSLHRRAVHGPGCGRALRAQRLDGRAGRSHCDLWLCGTGYDKAFRRRRSCQLLRHFARLALGKNRPLDEPAAEEPVSERVAEVGHHVDSYLYK